MKKALQHPETEGSENTGSGHESERPQADLAAVFGGLFNVRLLLLGFLITSTSVFGSTILVTDPTIFSSNNFVDWSQFGGDQTGLSSSFIAYSQNNQQINGNFDTSGGTVLSAGTDWSTSPMGTPGGGFQGGDALITTDDGRGAASGFKVGFSSAMYGAGAFIQGEGGTQFTATIQAFSGINSVLNTTITSDAAGDAMFVGVSSTLGQITSLLYTLKTGLSAENFVIGKLYLQDSPFATPPPDSPLVFGPLAVGPSPEPATTGLMALALLALGFYGRKFAFRNR